MRYIPALVLFALGLIGWGYFHWGPLTVIPLLAGAVAAFVAFATEDEQDGGRP